MKNSRRNFIRQTTAASLALPLLGLSVKENKNPVPFVIKPKALHPGDTIALTAPATAIWDWELINKFMSKLKEMGFNLKMGKTLTEKYGYFAGTDELRAKELNDFFADKEVNAIFCAKGGYGCARLLDSLDYEAIVQNPKVIMGFSDITSLLLGINKKTGLVTFHGPVGNSGLNDFTLTSFKSVLLEKEKTLFESPGKITLTAGKTKGQLIGGNLSVLTSIIGSNYLPDFKNKILFLEDTEEEPYSIDRMLTQLKLSGILTSVSGIIFGKCTKCVAEEPDKAFTYEQVLEQNIKPLNIPAFYNAAFGHTTDKFTLPLGIVAEMDAVKGTVILQDAAVD